MSLSYLMLTGSLSGLISVLAHSVIWSGVELVRGPRPSVDPGSNLAMAEAFMHMLGGIGLGVLFGLSWGLAGIVNVEWWMRGAAFAALCWIGLSLPTLLDLLLAHRITRTVAMLTASRWATTCLIAGLACAWSAERAM